jgi:hypothetical protein
LVILLTAGCNTVAVPLTVTVEDAPCVILQAALLPIVIFPAQLRLPPAVMAITPAFVVPEDPTVMFAETFKAEPLLKVSVPLPGFTDAMFNVAQAAMVPAGMFTLNPPSIFTTSPATGKMPVPTAEPPELSDQVVLLVQLPVALEKYVDCPIAAVNNIKFVINIIINLNIDLGNDFFMGLIG